MKIGYLGPEGSFSEEAALSVARGEEVIPLSSFRLMQALQEGTVQKIVLPIENSIDGPVTWVLDLLLSGNQFSIEAEIIWPIVQNLIGFGKLEDIEIVYSIPPALGQCRKLLDGLKVATHDAESTSGAVRFIAEKKDARLAAIGTKRAAELYKAPIITRNIGDNRNNQTRFLVLGSEPQGKTGFDDKTFFVFGTKNKTGALLRVLEVFDVLGINMTMIISRPSKIALGEYIFFCDIEGHRDDENVRVAFKQLWPSRVSFLKILGSYQRGLDKRSKGQIRKRKEE